MSRRFHRIIALTVAAALGCSAVASAYFERLNTSSRVLSLGEAFVSVADEPSTTLLNPAGLAQLSRLGVLTTYIKPYGISDLDETFFALAIPARAGVVGVSWHRMGMTDVTAEDLITVAFARDLIRTTQDASLSVGVSVDLARVSFEQPFVASDTKVSGGLGVLLRPFPIIGVGYSVRNLPASEFDFVAGGGGTRLGTTHSWGASYHWHQNVTISVERKQDLLGNWHDHAGIEVIMGPHVQLRSGITGRYATGGVGILWSGFSADVGVTSHDALGVSYVFSLGYTTPTEKNPHAQAP